MKKKILLLSDDILLPTGIGMMSKEIVKGTCHIFDWVQLGCNPSSNEGNVIRDMSKFFQEERNLTLPVSCIVYPFRGYGNPAIVMLLILKHKIDAILHFTDPRQWIWLYKIDNIIRKRVPIMYYNIWDNLPYPTFNQPYYDSCDLIMNITKQTNNIVKQVRQFNPVTELNCTYIPHGINSELFYPVDLNDQEYNKFKNVIFGNTQFKKIFYISNKNMRRKNLIDVITEYISFCKYTFRNSKPDTCLMLKTSVYDYPGTDFITIMKHWDLLKYNVVFIDSHFSEKELNYLNNIADVSINISSAEGFGLNVALSIMSGTPVISVVTGGLQDQMRFEDLNGNWMNLDEIHPSNLDQRFTKCGAWMFPIFPYVTTAGTVLVPYIYDNYIQDGLLAKKFILVYNTERTLLKKRGLKGRLFLISEGKFNAADMCNSMIKYINICINNFKPKTDIKLINVSKKIKMIPDNKGIYNRLSNTWE